ncbi:MAG TPA: Crp/Fnr family transcriptional regulator [Pyrinomonadaceae bacterium]|nr:Crp/Fnr family transcriptional regulator [Pyrinomonadaceae bacterium]
MSSLKVRETQLSNRLLLALPRPEHERLLPYFELVRLTPGKILYDVGDTVRHAYFPRGGMISLLSITQDGRTVEVGMVGNEGMIGLPTVLRCNVVPYQVMVQFAGNALRISANALKAQMSRNTQLQEILLCYTHALLIQIAQSAACNRFHTVEGRLCRWLLISHDRLTTDTLPLTQEFLSHMLGVPRTSVTAVARLLQEQGLIRYRRGKIIILNRAGLEIHSCECYRLVRNEIEQFLVA